MVKEKENCYYCEQCEMVYTDKKKACECEDFCKENNACNIDIIKHSIRVKGGNVK